MRATLAASLALLLAACASQQPAPAQPSSAAVPAEKATAASADKPSAQCWSGDHGRFFAVGDKAEISGVAVTCKATADGKSGQWVGGKH